MQNFGVTNKEQGYANVWGLTRCIMVLWSMYKWWISNSQCIKVLWCNQVNTVSKGSDHNLTCFSLRMLNKWNGKLWATSDHACSVLRHQVNHTVGHKVNMPSSSFFFFFHYTTMAVKMLNMYFRTSKYFFFRGAGGMRSETRSGY